jgi:hypothetical protein
MVLSLKPIVIVLYGNLKPFCSEGDFLKRQAIDWYSVVVCVESSCFLYGSTTCGIRTVVRLIGTDRCILSVQDWVASPIIPIFNRAGPMISLAVVLLAKPFIFLVAIQNSKTHRPKRMNYSTITLLRRLFNRTYTAAIASCHKAIATSLFVVFGCKRRGIKTFS